MKRLFWLAMGVTIGVLIVRKLSAAAERMTPKGMARGLSESLSELAVAIGEFGADVRAAMSEREEQLRRDTGLDGQLGQLPTLPGATRPRAVDGGEQPA